MSKKKITRHISVIEVPLNQNKESVSGLYREHRQLVESICMYRKDLEKRGIEIFERWGNIIATEKAYFIALFDEELRQMQDQIDNPTPYVGSDKRLKVSIVKPSGEKCEEDLALLVAKQFLPNPKNYKHCFFKDKNPSNVKADNLYWVSPLKYFILKTLYL